MTGHGDGVRRQAVCATETRRGHARQDSLPPAERCPRKGALAIRQSRQTRKAHRDGKSRGQGVDCHHDRQGTRRGQALAGVIALGRNWKADLFAVGEAKMCGGEDKAIEGETVCVRED